MSDLAGQMAEAFKHGHQAGQSSADQLRMDNGGSYTKAETNYRKADGTDSCAGCKHFDGTSKCDIVAGRISGSMVCDKFEASDTQDPSATEADQSVSPAATG